ncbi:DUF1653 domain-containing protein [Actinokineospora sp.]|uniref:DUF1653 domain-containing protein n=1 Tax=Actinokineospora sp. TaxID=1872133 RepID=UPI004038455A
MSLWAVPEPEDGEMAPESETWILLDYMNHRGERGNRMVRPVRVWRGRTDWHPEDDQWLLEAFDRDRQAVRNFAVRDIHNWRPPVEQGQSAEVRAGVYRHFKGRHYLVTGTARHSETEEEFVVYRTLYGKFDLWVRPVTHFQEDVPAPSGDLVPRFEYVDTV